MKQILIGQIHVKYNHIYIILCRNYQIRIRCFKNIFILTDILLPELMKEGEWVLL